MAEKEVTFCVRFRYGPITLAIRVVHITPHLGGGVGKALATVALHTSPLIERLFVLLENPVDRRFIHEIEASGSRVVISQLTDIRRHIDHADVVQVEWWNHPRVCEWLATYEMPEMRTVFWAHINGLKKPYIPEKLFLATDCFLFSSECSLHVDYISRYKHDCYFEVVNSGFGFPDPQVRIWGVQKKPRIGYLGTIDFEKMHKGFFDCIDKVQEDIRVSLWGRVDPVGEIADKVAAMKAPSRISFEGFTDNARSVLEKVDIFLYLLQPDHYGTGENALVEAMSLGCVPIVLDNPAEIEIVEHRVTGFIVSSIDEAAKVIDSLFSDPEELKEIGMRAAETAAKRFTPARTCAKLEVVYKNLIKKKKRKVNFSSSLGDNPRQWFLSTQFLVGESFDAGVLADDVRSQWCYTRFKDYFNDDFGI